MNKNEVLILYSSIMVSLLAIIYVLIITNPPSDLLQHDNLGRVVIDNLGRAVRIDNLSIFQIPEHWGSILIFSGLLAFLSFFIGLSVVIVYEVEVKGLRREILLGISSFLPVMLGLLLLPYYGSALTGELTIIGFLAYLLGAAVFSKLLRAQFIPPIIMTISYTVAYNLLLLKLISGQTAISILNILNFVLMILLVFEILITGSKRFKKKHKPHGRRGVWGR